jgi:cytochrome c
MKTTAFAALASAFLVAPAFADGHATGDAAEGEKVFKKCKSCHMIVDAEGEAIQKGGKTGPNLYGLYQRTAGSVEDFKYSKGLKAYGETGAVWEEASFLAWSKDPSKYLTEQLGKRERSKMSFKLKSEEDATNLWAYLVSVGPAAE